MEQICQNPTVEPLLPEEDVDGDGLRSTVYGGHDCDDSNALIHPDGHDICNGVDDDCDGIIDQWGCGKYIYMTSTPFEVHSFDLQTGADSLISGEGNNVSFYGLSPDNRRIAFSSPSTDSQPERNRTITIYAISGEFVQRIQIEQEIWGRSGWINDTTLIADLYCFPCGFESELGIEVKTNLITLDGNVTVLRPQEPYNEEIQQVYQNKILAWEHHDNDDLDREFVYDAVANVTTYLPFVTKTTGLFSYLDDSTLFFKDDTGTTSEGIYSYNFKSDQRTLIKDFGVKSDAGSIPTLLGSFLHSGRERLYLYFHSNARPEPSGHGSIYTDGTGESFRKGIIGDIPRLLRYIP